MNTPERDDFSSNRHPTPANCVGAWSFPKTGSHFLGSYSSASAERQFRPRQQARSADESHAGAGLPGSWCATRATANPPHSSRPRLHLRPKGHRSDFYGHQVAPLGRKIQSSPRRSRILLLSVRLREAPNIPRCSALPIQYLYWQRLFRTPDERERFPKSGIVMATGRHPPPPRVAGPAEAQLAITPAAPHFRTARENDFSSIWRPRKIADTVAPDIGG